MRKPRIQEVERYKVTKQFLQSQLLKTPKNYAYNTLKGKIIFVFSLWCLNIRGENSQCCLFSLIEGFPNSFTGLTISPDSFAGVTISTINRFYRVELIGWAKGKGMDRRHRNVAAFVKLSICHRNRDTILIIFLNVYAPPLSFLQCEKKFAK